LEETFFTLLVLGRSLSVPRLPEIRLSWPIQINLKIQTKKLLQIYVTLYCTDYEVVFKLWNTLLQTVVYFFIKQMGGGGQTP
jgi:hypothetical protein